MGSIMALRSVARVTFRIFFYTSLVFLPVTLFPTLQSIFAGVLFQQFHNQRIADGIHAYTSEIDRYSWMNQWSVPGAPTIWDHMDNKEPFFVPQLRTQTWHTKLGLTLPNVGEEDGIDRIASFDGAVRDVVACKGACTKEFWVYVSNLGMPQVFPWDAAFVQLLEHYSAVGSPRNASFAHVQCSSSPFLCNVWQVESPAFVHFIVDEDSRLEEDIALKDYGGPAEKFRPVEVRIIDLGLQEMLGAWTSSRFPSMFEQMRFLTTDECAYEVFSQYVAMDRDLDRFQKHFEQLASRDGSMLEYIANLDTWTTDHIAAPLALEDVVAEWAALVFRLTANAVFEVSQFWDLITELVHIFFGTPNEFDELNARLEQREQVNQGGGIFGGMVNGFMDFVETKLAENDSVVDVAAGPGFTANAEVRKSLMAKLRANVSSILENPQATA